MHMPGLKLQLHGKHHFRKHNRLVISAVLDDATALRHALRTHCVMHSELTSVLVPDYIFDNFMCSESYFPHTNLQDFQAGDKRDENFHRIVRKVFPRSK